MALCGDKNADIAMGGNKTAAICMSASSIKKVNTGIMFNLNADSGQVIATSEAYTT